MNISRLLLTPLNVYVHVNFLVLATVVRCVGTHNYPQLIPLSPLDSSSPFSSRHILPFSSTALKLLHYTMTVTPPSTGSIPTRRVLPQTLLFIIIRRLGSSSLFLCHNYHSSSLFNSPYIYCTGINIVLLIVLHFNVVETQLLETSLIIPPLHSLFKIVIIIVLDVLLFSLKVGSQ